MLVFSVLESMPYYLENHILDVTGFSPPFSLLALKHCPLSFSILLVISDKNDILAFYFNFLLHYVDQRKVDTKIDSPLCFISIIRIIVDYKVLEIII